MICALQTMLDASKCKSAMSYLYLYYYTRHVNLTHKYRKDAKTLAESYKVFMQTIVI